MKKKAKAIKIQHHHGGNDEKRWQKKSAYSPKAGLSKTIAVEYGFGRFYCLIKKLCLFFIWAPCYAFFYSLLFGFPHKCVVVTKRSPLFLYRNYQQVNKCRKKCVALQKKKMDNIIANKNGEDGFHRQC